MRVLNHFTQLDKAPDFDLDAATSINLWPDDTDEVNIDDLEEVHLDMIDWIWDNTKGHVYCYGDMDFGFESKDEATLFKMIWS